MITPEAISTPPAATRIEHFEMRHGACETDYYFWLREKSNPEVIAHLKAENAYTEAITAPLKPFEEALYQEMLGRIKQTDLSVPVLRSGYFYYSRTVEGQQYPIQCRRKGGMEAPEEILLDLNELAEGHAFLGLGAFSVSDDNRLLAYATDTTGFRQYTLYVKNLESGETLGDTAERITSVEWATDNRTLFFTTEDAVTKRSNELWRMALGGPREKIYEETDELFRVACGRSRDRKFLFLHIDSTDTSEVRYARADHPDAAWSVFLTREKKHRYSVDHREDLFYIRSNKDAKNFQILIAPDSDPDPKGWKVFLPHRSDVLIEDIDLFRNYAVALEKSEALNHLRILDFETGEWHAIPFPEPVYSAFPGSNPEYDSGVYRYSYQSLITPSSVFEFDMKRRTSTLLKQQEVLGGYDPAQYLSERLWVTARDGVRVPVSIVYRKDLVRDGKAPMLLYGYGSYGLGVPAAFSSSRVSLLDRGVVYAIAHVRGGDEMGEAWHDDGMLMKKKNTFFDFIDCAEYLIREKWTSPDRLAIQGGSAGGLLMGAVVNLRPDLFRAVVSNVPFVDVMNTMMDASLPLTVGEYLEWGDPNEKEAYDYMKSYSPYDNLERKSYPAILVTTSLNDSQVMYWEPAKYVARLRTLNTGSYPVLLKTNLGAGHGGASGRYDRLHEQAFEWTWMLSQLGIDK
ncbi:MAG TPA: S9 family peptidase [Bryobacteraceae bacterium]|jgi:oligopeptidase B|nr:S9 family peptidase [Bryobacteraceae bacterium]